MIQWLISFYATFIYFPSIFIYVHDIQKKAVFNSFPFEFNYSPIIFSDPGSVLRGPIWLNCMAASDPVLPFSFIVDEAFCIVGCGETVMPAVWLHGNSTEIHGNYHQVGTQGTPMAWSSANEVFRCVQLKLPGGSVAVQERGQEPWLLGWQ